MDSRDDPFIEDGTNSSLYATATDDSLSPRLPPSPELPRVNVVQVRRLSTRSPTRHADGGPPAKIARTGTGADVSARLASEDDGATCSICLDSWSNSGPHRLVCLKCGHLFGHACLMRWLKSLPVKERRCPTCKAKANIRDIRCLYARKLVAVDTAELNKLREQLDKAESDKKRVELELHKSNLAAAANLGELNRGNKIAGVEYQGDLLVPPAVARKQRSLLAQSKRTIRSTCEDDDFDVDFSN